MKVTEFPGSPEAAAAQAALTEKMTRAYTEDGALKIIVNENTDGGPKGLTGHASRDTPPLA